jgi:serine/threonine protein kinase
MISYHGEVKIVDFGIAKTEYKIHRTQAGVLKGKFAYMSPEQSMGQELNNQTDIFSAGIILYEMLANKRLFLGGTDFETLENIKKCEVPPLREINPKVSKELEQVVLKSLAKNQSDRFQTAGQMQNALSKVLYTEFPHFTQDHLSKKLFLLFEEDIKKETENLKKAIVTIGAEQVENAQSASLKADHENSQKHTRTEREKKPFFLIPWLIALWALLGRIKYPLLFILIMAVPILFGKLFQKDETPTKSPPKQEAIGAKNICIRHNTTQMQNLHRWRGQG